MEKKSESSVTVLDVSKGLGFGFLYRPIIGNKGPHFYPFSFRFPPSNLKKRKKRL